MGLGTTLALAFFPQSTRAQSHVIINEIDYVQPGTSDSLEWIELRNAWDVEWNTNNAFLVFYHVDPSGECHEYHRVDLSPLSLIVENSYYVIGVHPCADPHVSLGATHDVIGNGPGDAIVLQQGTLVLDSVEYNAVSSQSSCNLVATPVVDSHAVPGSMQRCQNSWIFSSTSTPCAPNNCTVSDVPSWPARTLWGVVKSLYR
jgi:hypothetical protein